MKIYSPDNYFTKMFFGAAQKETSYLPSSLVTSELIKNSEAVGLIPIMDLINHRDLFISKRYGISFEGSLCNTYIYFGDSEKISEFTLTGDVSSVEALLSKILFKEMYDTDILLKIDTTHTEEQGTNIILTGNSNFISGSYTEGISFSEEMTEIINLPFVNYVLASANKEALDKFHQECSLDEFDNNIEDLINKNIPPNARDYFLNNISSLVVKLDEQDIEGIDQIIRLPYYHGMLKDLFELKYV